LTRLYTAAPGSDLFAFAGGDAGSVAVLS
jgi:U3 small nucleolar RNA-associated protein 18